MSAPPAPDPVLLDRPHDRRDRSRRHPDDAVATGGLVARTARWSATHRWTAIGLWVLLVVGSVAAGLVAGNRELTAAEYGVGASAPADAALSRSDFGDVPSESVLVRAADGGTVDPASPAVTGLAERLGALDGVSAVSPPLPSADGGSVLLQVELAAGTGDDSERAAVAEDAARAVAGALADAEAPGLVLAQTGDTSLGLAVDEMYSDDLRRAELLSVPVTLGILVLVFGALIAAGIPVLLALTSVAGAFGLSQLASHLVPSSDVLASVILLVGMAVGVDYSLFYVRRERQERLRGAGTVEAVTVAAATSGRAVVVSGAAVTVSMAGMFLAGEATFSSLAVGTILVVSVAVVGSVTVLPAVLALLGRWVDRPRVPLLHRLRRRDGGSRFWPAVLRPVLARPLAALVVGTVALLTVAAPALGMRLGFPGLEDLPDDVPAVAAYEAVTTAYPSQGASHTVAVWSEDGEPLDRVTVDAAVTALASATAGTPPFATGDGLAAEYSQDGDVARLRVPVSGEPDSDEASRSVVDLREDLLPTTLGALPGVDVAVTGPTAGSDDFEALLAERMPWVVAFVLLLTVTVLVLSFRSLAVALTAAALNLLSVGAAYGVLVLVFQGTWAEGLLGFTSNGAVVTWLPLFLFVILFGLSMDYHVFVVSRIRELALAGVPVRRAVRDGITGTAGTVTSAAVVMVAVFSIFATLTPLDFKQLGVGLAVAIAIDATIVRAVLLPSAMALLGERNWWLPGWMARGLDRLPDLAHR
ncbi:MMPL family transporter [Thalassiella azotivora]